MPDKKSKYCNCLYYSANALSRIMTKMADDAFSTTGLTASYAFLLMIVNERPGIQPGEISCQMQLKPSTVTRLIEKMEYKGFLKREQTGRTTQVYPTPASKKLNPQIKKAWSNLYQQYADILGNDHAKNLTQSIYEATLKLE